jgi:hypothetical protein
MNLCSRRHPADYCEEISGRVTAYTGMRARRWRRPFVVRAMVLELVLGVLS